MQENAYKTWKIFRGWHPGPPFAAVLIQLTEIETEIEQ